MSVSKEVLLGVNIDHIATIRQARGTRYPEPVHAVIAAEQAGADSITLHLREDRRHIQERDVYLLKDIIQTRMNLEMAITPEMLAIAEKVQPENCCLVPERREELTTEGGLDVMNNLASISDACARLAAANVRVSLFIDADHAQIDAALKAGAPDVEIHTGQFADAVNPSQAKAELAKIINAVDYAHSLGLRVNAGHGLHYHNVRSIACIGQVHELNIGHAIVAQALFDGFASAVREMKRLMVEARKIGW